MFDQQEWAARVAGQNCPVCRVAGEPPDAAGPVVVTLPSGRVVLQDDAAFRGYCILYYRRHVPEFYDLAADERAALSEDVSCVARAVATLCRPAKINYAILGNEVPHLHVHVVPRYPGDGWWGQAFSLRPTTQRLPLESAEFARLRAELRAQLMATGRCAGGPGCRPDGTGRSSEMAS